MNEIFGYDPRETNKYETDTYLDLPEKTRTENKEKGLAKKLGQFLADKDFINQIKMWSGSWGFKYENKDIYVSEKPMPDSEYHRYIIELGKNIRGENLFPNQGDETDQYRFLHETSHAYQDYLIDQESPEDPNLWHDKAIKGEIDSTFAFLFKYCYQKRTNNPGKGLSTWGNVPDYNSIPDLRNQNAKRAIEDANELVTMYLWNPKYLDAYLDYLSLNINGINETDLNNDKLIKISDENKENIKEVIGWYIEEMKEKLGFDNPI